MEKKTKTQFKGVAMLLLTAAIWGSAFVAQSAGMEKVDAFTFNGLRSVIAAAVLLVFIVIRDAAATPKMTPAQITERKAKNKKVLACGSVLGVVFCVACNLQQCAFYDSDSDTIAFITALYMFFVPLIGLIFRKRIPLITWGCIIVGFIGLYFLCIDPAAPFNLNKGDVLAFFCAIFFAIQILMIEKYAPEVDGVKLSFVQFAVSGIISCILMFIFENPNIKDILSAWLPILYASILSSCVAYTLQIVGQKYTEATVASLLMCMESVFAVLATAVVYGIWPTPRKGLGCTVMFAAIIVSQISEPLMEKIKKRKNRT